MSSFCVSLILMDFDIAISHVTIATEFWIAWKWISLSILKSSIWMKCSGMFWDFWAYMMLYVLFVECWPRNCEACKKGCQKFHIVWPKIQRRKMAAILPLNIDVWYLIIVSLLLFLSSTAQRNWLKPIHFKTNRPAKPRWSLSKVISSPELLGGGGLAGLA